MTLATLDDAGEDARGDAQAGVVSVFSIADARVDSSSIIASKAEAL